MRKFLRPGLAAYSSIASTSATKRFASSSRNEATTLNTVSEKPPTFSTSVHRRMAPLARMNQRRDKEGVDCREEAEHLSLFPTSKIGQVQVFCFASGVSKSRLCSPAKCLPFAVQDGHAARPATVPHGPGGGSFVLAACLACRGAAREARLAIVALANPPARRANQRAAPRAGRVKSGPNSTGC
jgi:hypothetical protein